VSMHDCPLDSMALALEHPMWIIVPSDGHLGNKLYLGVNKLFADYSPELHATIMKAASRTSASSKPYKVIDVDRVAHHVKEEQSSEAVSGV
jgi:hypothetical protein